MAYMRALVLGVSLFFLCSTVGVTGVALAGNAVASAQKKVDKCGQKIQAILDKIKSGKASRADVLKLRDLEWELISFEEQLERAKASQSAPAAGSSAHIEQELSGIEDASMNDAAMQEQQRIMQEQLEMRGVGSHTMPGSPDSGGAGGSGGGYGGSSGSSSGSCNP